MYWLPSDCSLIPIMSFYTQQPCAILNNTVFDVRHFAKDNGNDISKQFFSINEQYFRESIGKRHIISKLFKLLIRTVQEVYS